MARFSKFIPEFTAHKKTQICYPNQKQIYYFYFYFYLTIWIILVEAECSHYHP